MKERVAGFASRWLVSTLGLWIAAALLGSDHINFGSDKWPTVILSGLFLALANMFVRPLVVFLSFPAIILTLGLFMLVVNGLLILLVSWSYNSFYVSSIWVAIVAGVIVGLVNYLVSRILKD